MDVRFGLVFVLLLVGGWACDARPLTASDLTGTSSTFQFWPLTASDLTGLEKKVDVCALCEEYASIAVDYLNENKTQLEIIAKLHDACSEMHSLKQQCITLVDYYGTLFFAQVSSVQPDEFCEKVNLCQGEGVLALPKAENSCSVCHRAVDEVIVKLKDPDTELEILEILLKACDAVEGYVRKCKPLVLEYGPAILANAGKFIEKTDICASVHACGAQAEEKLDDGKIKMVTASS